MVVPDNFRTVMACPDLFPLPFLDETTALNNFISTPDRPVAIDWPIGCELTAR